MHKQESKLLNLKKFNTNFSPAQTKNAYITFVSDNGKAQFIMAGKSQEPPEHCGIQSTSSDSCQLPFGHYASYNAF